MKLKLGKKNYEVKYGSRAVAKSGICRDAMNIQTLAETEDMGVLIESMLETVVNMLLAGFQKTVEQFAVDYDDIDDVKAKKNLMYDFVDDYLEQDDAMDITELFQSLMEELMNGGFFGKKSAKLTQAMVEVDATVVPLDHKKR